MMAIHSFPTFHSAHLKKPDTTPDHMGLVWPAKTTWLYKGRAAVYYSIKALSLNPGDEILFPAYHCQSIVNAVLETGCRIKFYDIERDTNIDIKTIEGLITDKTKALFIIHYYGFPQPISEIKELCQKHKLFLMEDCAHALFSRDKERWLGSSGDISIYTVYKTLPVPDGGVLVINNDNFNLTDEILPQTFGLRARNRFFLIKNSFQAKYEASYKVFKLLIENPLRWLFRFYKKLLKNSVLSGMTDATSYRFNPALAKYAAQKMTKVICENTDVRVLVNQRRNKFQFLLNRFKNNKQLKCLYPHLPMGVCPLFFPIILEDRDRVYDALVKNNVHAFIFGKDLHNTLLKDQCPQSRHFADHVLCLPIHEDISQSQLNMMAEQVESMYLKGGMI